MSPLSKRMTASALLTLPLCALFFGQAASAQPFPITIDATNLSAPQVSLHGVASFAPDTPPPFNLSPGLYALGYVAGGGSNPRIEFTVTATGAVDYDAASAGLLSGAGTSTLIVLGETIQIDNRLSAPDTHFYTWPVLPHGITTLNLLPGDHDLNYTATTGLGPTARFRTFADGTVGYAAVLEGVLVGAGTDGLIVDGANIVVDNRLSAPDTHIYTWPVLPSGVTTLNLLPGDHDLNYTSTTGSGPTARFRTFTDGTIGYAAELEGILIGGGTDGLVVDGANIVVENRLSAPNTHIYTWPVLPQAITTLNLLPGDHDLNYTATTGQGPTARFRAIADGTVSYATELEGILVGAGTDDLVVDGANIVVDNRLSAPDAHIYTWPVLPQGITTLNLLPGDHDLNYTATLSAGPPTARYRVVTDGTVTYASELEGVLYGAGTSSFIIDGAQCRIASGSAALLTIYTWPPFSPCDALHLLPGTHSLTGLFPNADFQISVSGLVDFAPALDAVWAGRGTEELQFKNQSGTPAVCNRPPEAVCHFGQCSVEATGPNGATVPLFGLNSFDPDGDMLTFHWDVSDLDVVLDDPDSPVTSGVFPVGVTMATLTVSDGRGGVDTCDTVVTVRDTTPPQVMCATDLAMLWPPNHTMRRVQLVISVSDAVASGPRPVVTIRSDEPDDANGNGDGSTTGDVAGADGYSSAVDVSALLSYDPARSAWIASVLLRAERAGSGDGRCYMIDIQAQDSVGNTSTSSCCVVVPHDQRP